MTSLAAGPNFFHDLVTVDFHQTDIKTGVRIAIILIIVTVLGLITGYAAEAGFVVICEHRLCPARQNYLLIHEHASC